MAKEIKHIFNIDNKISNENTTNEISDVESPSFSFKSKDFCNSCSNWHGSQTFRVTSGNQISNSSSRENLKYLKYQAAFDKVLNSKYFNEDTEGKIYEEIAKGKPSNKMKFYTPNKF